MATFGHWLPVTTGCIGQMLSVETAIKMLSKELAYRDDAGDNASAYHLLASWQE